MSEELIPDTATRVVDVVVVGAGFAGLYSLYKATQMGLSVVGIEAGHDVGGTWYWNKYPGARCDAESFDYSFSFSEDLQQEWEWSERYPAQPELLAYLRHVAERFELRDLIEFDTKVVEARFDEDAAQWTVVCDNGLSYYSTFCVMATGCLTVPKRPDIAGLDSFSGGSYFTSRWPERGVDFTGLDVAVIGTGSTGIQCIPMIAEQAKTVTVFQRTPSFSIPARNAPLDYDVVRERKATYREYRERARWSASGVPATPTTVSALEVSHEERNALYQECWDEGGVLRIMTAYSDLLVSEDANVTLADFIRGKIASTVSNSETARQLMPTEYPFGARRPCLDTNFYETFNRSNVSLVSLRSEAIERIVPAGIQTDKQVRNFDAIVFATGFDAMTGALLSINIVGRGGTTLEQEWSEGPVTYLGLAVAGFPNLFTVTGPGSPSVKTNMVAAIEQHVEWIFDCISYMRERKIAVIDVEGAAQDRWTRHVRDLADGSLLGRANSWYRGANIPGKPQVFMVYLGGLDTYRARCDDVAAHDYDGFTLSGEAPPKAVISNIGARSDSRVRA